MSSFCRALKETNEASVTFRGGAEPRRRISMRPSRGVVRPASGRDELSLFRPRDVPCAAASRRSSEANPLIKSCRNERATLPYVVRYTPSIIANLQLLTSRLLAKSPTLPILLYFFFHSLSLSLVWSAEHYTPIVRPTCEVAKKQRALRYTAGACDPAWARNVTSRRVAPGIRRRTRPLLGQPVYISQFASVWRARYQVIAHCIPWWVACTAGISTLGLIAVSVPSESRAPCAHAELDQFLRYTLASAPFLQRNPYKCLSLCIFFLSFDRLVHALPFSDFLSIFHSPLAPLPV